jgi:hypothetical protein
MNSLSNLYLFAFAIAKVGALTGLIPALILGVIFERCPFPFCVLRDSYDDDHDVQVPIERFIPFREQAELFPKVRAGQLAPELNLIPANEFNRATSPARKVKTWRTA